LQWIADESENYDDIKTMIIETINHLFYALNLVNMRDLFVDYRANLDEIGQ